MQTGTWDGHVYLINKYWKLRDLITKSSRKTGHITEGASQAQWNQRTKYTEEVNDNMGCRWVNQEIGNS